MKWKSNRYLKRDLIQVSGLWFFVVVLVWFVASCGSVRVDPTGERASPTAIPHKKASPLVSTPPTRSQPLTPHVESGDWPSFLLGGGGFNPNETSITSTTASSLTRSWMAHAGGGISSEPVVVDGIIYWGSWDGYEHASSVDGHALWSTYLGKASSPQCYPPTVGVASTATIVPVMIKGVSTLVDFVGGGNANLYALDATTGKILWATSLGSAPGTFIWGSPVVYQDDLYIGTASVGECPGTAGHVFKLDVATGSIEHDLELVPEGCLGVGIWSSPTLDADAGELYLTTSNASSCNVVEPYAMSMLEVHAATLSVVGSWQVPDSEAVADGDFGSTPTLFTARLGGASRQLVGAVNKNGIFYAFQRGAISAGPVWRARISSSPVAGCNQCPSGDEAAAAWDGSALYVGSTSTTIGGKFCYGSVRALDPATGTFLWQQCLSSAFRVMAPVITVPGLVVASAGPAFFVLDARQGTIVYRYQDTSKDSTFDGAATIAHGTLYIGNLDGTLFAFTPDNE
jgi:outer membrane protein assembly factor BamB